MENNKLDELLALYKAKKDAELAVKEIEARYKELQSEIFDEADDKFTYGNYNITKTSRTTYKLKDGILPEAILIKYPSAAKVDTGVLFKIAENPEELLDASDSNYFLIKESKAKKEQPEF